MDDNHEPQSPQHGSSGSVTISKRALRRVGIALAVLVLAGIAYGVGRVTSTSRAPLKAAAAKASITRHKHDHTTITDRTTTTVHRPASTTTTAPTTTTTTIATTTTTTPTPLPGAPYSGFEPSTIAFSNDGTNIVSHLVWQSWGTQQAVGHGEWGYVSCNPDCAANAPVYYPAAITLSDPSNGLFAKAEEQTSGPEGSTQTFVYSPPLNGSGTPWAFSSQ